MNPIRLSVLLACLLTSVCLGQATRPAGEAATQPAGVDEPFSARVIRLQGSASYALIDASGERGPWKPLKVGDQLPAGSVVRTQLRSKAVLAFGEDSVVVIEPATLANIDQFHRSGDTKKIELGLGHGTLRAGVQETTLRSDMTIETPSATLSKRGTMDFGISYEPSTNRFRIFLAKEGLVEAIHRTSGESRLVRPGQYVTQAMVAWIDTLTHDRWVPVVDTTGLTDAEQIFQTVQSSGLATVQPGDGANRFTIGSRDLAGLAGRTGGTGVSGTPSIPPSPTPGGGAIPRPEGNFGTGSGTLSVLFKSAR